MNENNIFLVIFKNDVNMENFHENYLHDAKNFVELFGDNFQKTKNKDLIKLFYLTQLFVQLRQTIKEDKEIVKFINKSFKVDYVNLLKKFIKSNELNLSEIQIEEENFFYLIGNIFKKRYENFQYFKNNNTIAIEFINDLLHFIENNNVGLIKDYYMSNYTDICPLANTFNYFEDYLDNFIDVNKTDYYNYVLQGLFIGIDFDSYQYYSKNNIVLLKKESNIYTFVNIFSGKKIRFSFTMEVNDVKNFENNEIKRYPEIVEIKITNKDYCNNLSKKYVFDNFEYVNIKDIKSIIETLSKTYVFEISLCGSEPSIHPNFLEIVDCIFSNGMICNIKSRNKYLFKNKDVLIKFCNRIINSINYIVYNIEDLTDVVNIKEEIIKNRNCFAYNSNTFNKYVSQNLINRISCDIFLENININDLIEIIKKVLSEELINNIILVIPEIDENNNDFFEKLDKILLAISLKFDNNMKKYLKKHTLPIFEIKCESTNKKSVEIAKKFRDYLHSNDLPASIKHSHNRLDSLFLDAMEKFICKNYHNKDKKYFFKMPLIEDDFLNIWKNI